MSFSLILYEHHTPTEVRPILGTRDPEIIAVVRRLLMERMEGEPVREPVPHKRPGARRAKKEKESHKEVRK